MKNFSISRLAEIVLSQRKKLSLTQQELADKAGINRSMLCRLENQEYMPSLDQLTRLANTLQFDVSDVFIEYSKPVFQRVNPRNITVFGAGHVGLSIATLLARHHNVTIVDVNPEKVEKINQRVCPFQDEYIEKYFARANLHLTATFNQESACRDVDFIIIAVPTGYTSENSMFNTSVVENLIEKILRINPNVTIIVRSYVPIGFSLSICEKYSIGNILFSPGFLCKSKAFYDTLYPSRIIIGSNESSRERATDFADMLQSAVLKKDVEIRLTGLSEAEAIAFFFNIFLAMRISCFNELDTYAELKGLDAHEIIDGICLDPRIGSSCSNPSFGFSSFCLPESTRQLLTVSDPILYGMTALIMKSNQNRKDYIVDRISEMVGLVRRDNLHIEDREKKMLIGIFRLISEYDPVSPCDNDIFTIIRQLKANGATIIIYEPALVDGSSVFNCKVINDLKKFKKQSNIIIANRYDSCLDNVKQKVYSRDLAYIE